MNSEYSETYGMFGPQGFLAKMEATEEAFENRDNYHKPSGKVFENTPIESSIVPQEQHSTENPEKCIQDVNDLSLTSAKSRSIPFVALSDLSPIEGALSIEKVLKNICSFLEPHDLLNCRLVSSYWLRVATTGQLLKQSKNAIRITRSLQYHNSPACVIVKNQKRRLEDVTGFFDYMISWAHPFPCFVSLELELTTAKNDFFEFFDRYGYAVNFLTLKFQAKENGKYFIYQMDSFMELLTKLLTEQLPNLETLDVKFDTYAKFPSKIDPQLLVSIKNGLYCAGKQNDSLRSIEFNSWTPFDVIEAVCSLAPHVEKLRVHDLRFWVTHKHRLCLFKTFHFSPSPFRRDQIDALDAILNSEEKVKLKKFTTQLLYTEQDFPPLATQVKKVLQTSFDSLEELDIDHYFLILRKNFPPVMPKVRLISVRPHPYFDSERNLSKAISLVRTLPNLHTIKCCGHEEGIMRFLTYCKNEEVASVKRIETFNCDIDKKAFQKYFPNAVVTKHK